MGVVRPHCRVIRAVQDRGVGGELSTSVIIFDRRFENEGPPSQALRLDVIWNPKPFFFKQTSFPSPLLSSGYECGMPNLPCVTIHGEFTGVRILRNLLVAVTAPQMVRLPVFNRGLVLLATTKTLGKSAQDAPKAEANGFTKENFKKVDLHHVWSVA